MTVHDQPIRSVRLAFAGFHLIAIWMGLASFASGLADAATVFVEAESFADHDQIVGPLRLRHCR